MNNWLVFKWTDVWAPLATDYDGTKYSDGAVAFSPSESDVEVQRGYFERTAGPSLNQRYLFVMKS